MSSQIEQQRKHFKVHFKNPPIQKSRSAELLTAGVPALVVQGGNDPFGRPAEFPAPDAASGDVPYELVEVPYGDHGFAVPKRAPSTGDEALELITRSVAAWLGGLREC